ncbi:hypothetical protein V1290_001404 [Bradyrhizobium sp. AZCC 1578]
MSRTRCSALALLRRAGTHTRAKRIDPDQQRTAPLEKRRAAQHPGNAKNKTGTEDVGNSTSAAPVRHVSGLNP